MLLFEGENALTMLMADGDDDIINSADDAATAAVDDRAEFIDGILIFLLQHGQLQQSKSKY